VEGKIRLQDIGSQTGGDKGIDVGLLSEKYYLVFDE